MKVCAIIQARMSSCRLPGKVLAPIGHKPMLLFLLERLKHCRELEEVIVATSQEFSDNPINDLCVRNKVRCIRGPLENVASRFAQTITEFDYDAFVRISGDSPLLDSRLVDRLIQVFKAGDYDLVTNVQRRTFPMGQSVEVVRGQTFKQIQSDLNEPEDQEHVTRYFYRCPQKFEIYNVDSERPWGEIKLAVDTPSDLDRLKCIISKMVRPQWTYDLEETISLWEDTQ